MMAKTAEASKVSPAELAGIQDPDVAFAFNIECAEIAQEDANKREARMFEAFGMGSVTQALGGQPETKAQVERW